MKLRPSARPGRIAVVVSAALAVGGGAVVVATHIAGATTGAPTGTSLCVQNSFGLVLTPTAGGRCLAGQSEVSVANLSGVSDLSQAVANLQATRTVAFLFAPGGAGGNGSVSNYVVPAGTTELRVELWGGGGGGTGGGSSATTGSVFGGGGGGAQGDYVHSVINVVPGDTCTVVVGSGGTGGNGTTGDFGRDGLPGNASSFSCTQSPASLTAAGGVGGVGQIGGVDPATPSPNASFQTYAGEPGRDGGIEALPGTGGGAGGGIGFPATGGNGGGVEPGPGDPAQGGAAGLVLVTPVGST